MSVSVLSADRAPAGFAQLYREHHGFAWQTLRCLGVVDSALDDAMQDVFVVVYRRLSEFEGRASVRTWIFEIARRVALRYRARAHRDAARTFELPELRSEDDLDAAVDRALAFEVLRAFTDSLDEDRLRVFMLSEFGQLRGREIAEATGVNINTVYARLRSAHKQLDRLVTRLRARETGAMVQSVRRSRPSRTSTRRTWVAVAAKVGVSSTSAASVGAGGLGGLGWLGWLGVAGLTAALVAGVVATRAVEPRGASPRRATAEPAVVGAAVPQERSATAPPPQAAPPPVTTAPEEPGRATTADAEPSPSPSIRAAAPRGGRTPRAALAAEVAFVRELRAAVTRGQAVQARLARYHRKFPRGVLRPEVEALVIEHRCRTRRVDSEAEIAAFMRRWPRSALVERLRSVCSPSIGPQKTARADTQSL